jgi:hypothetical protein
MNNVEVRLSDPEKIKEALTNLRAVAANNKLVSEKSDPAFEIVSDVVVPVLLDIRTLLMHMLNATGQCANALSVLVTLVAEEQKAARGMTSPVIDPKLLRVRE